MVLLWYYNGIIIGGKAKEERWHDGLLTREKTWRIMVKNEFLRKNLVVSDILFTFAYRIRINIINPLIQKIRTRNN